MRFSRAADGCNFAPIEADAFYSAMAEGEADAVPTVLFIHGNLTPHASAIEETRQLDRVLDTCTDNGYRLILWSWPSDRVLLRIRPDSRLKAHRAEVQAAYLAEVMRRIAPSQPWGVVGYSFGARTILGALNRLRGASEGAAPPVGLVLLATAADRGSLAPGHRYGQATSECARLLITVNRCDPALRYYPLMYGVCGPEAIGLVGPGPMAESDGDRTILDVSWQVGRSHHLSNYLCAPALRDRLATTLFLEAPDAAAEAEQPSTESAESTPPVISLESP